MYARGKRFQVVLATTDRESGEAVAQEARDLAASVFKNPAGTIRVHAPERRSGDPERPGPA